MTAPWTPCPSCENHWCNVHDMHAFECPCPAIEDWDTDPYEEPCDNTLTSSKAGPEPCSSASPST